MMDFLKAQPKLALQRTKSILVLGPVTIKAEHSANDPARHHDPALEVTENVERLVDLDGHESIARSIGVSFIWKMDIAMLRSDEHEIGSTSYCCLMVFYWG